MYPVPNSDTLESDAFWLWQRWKSPDGIREGRWWGRGRRRHETLSPRQVGAAAATGRFHEVSRWRGNWGQAIIAPTRWAALMLYVGGRNWHFLLKWSNVLHRLILAPLSYLYRSQSWMYWHTASSSRRKKELNLVSCFLPTRSYVNSNKKAGLNEQFILSAGVSKIRANGISGISSLE